MSEGDIEMAQNTLFAVVGTYGANLQNTKAERMEDCQKKLKTKAKCELFFGVVNMLVFLIWTIIRKDQLGEIYDLESGNQHQ